QFNHMILFVPAGQNWPELWIDPTDKAASRRPIPLDLEGKVSLVIHGDSSYITVTPILEKDQEHRANLNHSLFLDSSGHAEFRDSLTLYGMFASAIRAEMLARDSKERQRYFTDWLTQAIPDAKLSSLQVENVLEFTKPLILVLTFTSDHYFAQTPSHIQAPYPNLWERSFLRLPKVAHRHHPLRLPHETQFNWSLQVRGPQGAKVQLQSSNLSLEKLNYVQIDQAPQFQASRATLRWRTLATYADASEYNAIRREWNAVLNTTAPIVVLEK
ncbi:MAG TPA: hypothetical protein VLM37_08005, partial [Fibrobacteraceae bacterium]|nr:hypothetical protein [Fibrobacteraceae bacterium]